MSEKENKETNYMTRTYQVFGLVAIVSGIFGVSYQKGLIMGMGLGNMAGNYEMREVFNSAILGYMYILSVLVELDFWKPLKDSVYLVWIFPVLAILGTYFIRKNKNDS
ncbi:MAG: hypothetical protein OQK04_11915, partial [Kangiellaceae bacterium]|nr:hypothetical protein [Kangiellaceae bacterium]